jgi:hypothetical protein
MAAIMVACNIVRVLAPTEVPKAFPCACFVGRFCIWPPQNLWWISCLPKHTHTQEGFCIYHGTIKT